jgi:hypothetical protein
MSRNPRPAVTVGYVMGPQNDVTRGYRDWRRADWADGTTAFEYSKDDGVRVLVFNRFKGTRDGFLWVDTTRGGAVRRFRNGERCDRYTWHKWHRWT